MFLRIVKAAGGKGVQHEYVRLVESYRAQGKVKQRLVASLGRKDLLADHFEALNRLLASASSDARGDPRSQAEASQAWDWGTLLVARSLWRELGLEQILDRLAGGRQRQAAAFTDRVFALVANRLEARGSEHGLAGWLDACGGHRRQASDKPQGLRDAVGARPGPGPIQGQERVSGSGILPLKRGFRS